MTQTEKNGRLDGRGAERVTFICDQAVDIHFPAHFRDVYLDRLPYEGWSTQVFARVNNPASPIARELGARPDTTLSVKPSKGRLARPLAVLRGFADLWRRFRNTELGRSDVYVVHNDPFSGWLAWLWARRTGARFVYRITHLNPETVAERGGMWRLVGGGVAFLRDALINRSDLLVPMSQRMAETLGNRTRVAKSRIVAIASCVELPVKGKESPHCQTLKSDVAALMTASLCKKWAVYVGTLNPGRNLSFLVDIVARLSEKMPEIGLLVLGVSSRPEYLARIQDYARKRGMYDRIVWHPPVPEDCLPDIIALADVGLSPFPLNQIYVNNSPVKVLEYLRSGIPVVSSAVPDAETVIAGCGLGIVADNTPESFAAAVVQLMDAPSCAETSGAARVWLSEHRSIAACTRQWLMVLETALEQTS